MKIFIHYIIILFMMMFPVLTLAQVDSSLKQNEYERHDNYPLYHYCKNCKAESGRPSFLCGHLYNTLFAGYSFDGKHWAEMGYARDRTSCFPEEGSNYLAASYMLQIDRKALNGIKLTYLRDNLLGLQFYYLKYGVNIETISDFAHFDFIIRPEIRLGDNMGFNKILNGVNISYGYNFQLPTNSLGVRPSHQLTIIFNLIQRGFIS